MELASRYAVPRLQWLGATAAMLQEAASGESFQVSNLSWGKQAGRALPMP